MNLELRVFHNQILAGHLVEEDSGVWAFLYDQRFLERDGINEMLSLNFPPRESPYRGADLMLVFRNLLPDGSMRRRLCHRIGISEGNDFALLGALGGDCFGALALSSPSDPHWLDQGQIRPLTEQDLRNIVAALALTPALVDVSGSRFALPGEHHKIPVRLINDQLALCLGNECSSHIAKPAKEGLKESVMNEGFCLELARSMGLNCAPSNVRHGAVTTLLVERIDRIEENGSWQAVQAEDFCQLLGVPPEKKFEREGGLGAIDCLQAIRRYSSRPALDIRQYLKWLMFNFFIGNGGAHAKQLAMRHNRLGPRLAPFYGIMSTHVYQSLHRRLSMSIMNEDRPDWLIPARWREFALLAEVRPSYIIDCLRDMADRITPCAAQVAEQFQREHGHANVIRDVRRLLEQRARQLIVALEAERA